MHAALLLLICLCPVTGAVQCIVAALARIPAATPSSSSWRGSRSTIEVRDRDCRCVRRIRWRRTTRRQRCRLDLRCWLLRLMRWQTHHGLSGGGSRLEDGTAAFGTTSYTLGTSAWGCHAGPAGGQCESGRADVVCSLLCGGW